MSSKDDHKQQFSGTFQPAFKCNIKPKKDQQKPITNSFNLFIIGVEKVGGGFCRFGI